MEGAEVRQIAAPVLTIASCSSGRECMWEESS